jgi:MFS family permease
MSSSTTMPRRHWWPFVAGVFAIVILLLGSNLPNPLFPLYAREFGLSSLDITLVFATYTLLVIPALLLLAPLSDARGRRAVLAGAIVVAAAAAGLFAAADGVGWLLAAQAVQALALGALQGTAAPALVENDPTGNTRRAAAIASAATLAGAALGPLLAGVLAAHAPLSPRLPYLVEVALLAVAFAGLRMLPHSASDARWRPRRPEIPAPIRRPFVIAAVSAFVGWAVTGLFLALIPSFVVMELHGGLVFAGLILTIMLGCSAVTAALSPRLPSLPTQISGIVTMGIGVGVLFAAARTSSLPLLLVSTLVAGVGQGLTFAGSLADVNELAPEEHKANTVASYFVVVYPGTALPVIGVGALAGSIGLVAAIQVFAVVVVAACLAGLIALLAEHRARAGALAT